jgi:serine/threonine protein kinase
MQRSTGSAQPKLQAMNIDASDATSLDALDGYLSALQAGRRAGKDELLTSHPELAGLVECLEDLDRLAEPSESQDARATLPLGPSKTKPTGAAFPDFGAYEVECELGRGGMGVVYKAKQKGLDRPVALKMILCGQLANEEQLGRFRDEARLAAKLHHPNIVSIYEAGELLGQPYFAMQYVGGPSLTSKLCGGALPADEAAQLLLTIACAVEHLHQHGIVHRDLKPSNILLDEAGVPYVTDFGLVKTLAGDSQRTRTGVIVGTPSYMAPEQAAGKGGHVGPLSDVYSLGAILYEMLTGRPPFRESTPLDTLVQVLEGEPRPPSELNREVPHDLELICLRCLEKDAARRYPSAAALAQDLERFLTGEAVEARDVGLGRRLLRWSRREPALVAHLITLGGCTLIAQTAYHLTYAVSASFHFLIIGILVAWMAASYACQLLLNQQRWADTTRFIWVGLDVAFFTLILHVDDAFVSPLIVGYPLLVAASGLWFRVTLVWFTTAIAALSFAVLMALNWDAVIDAHKYVMFLVVVVVLGFIVAYQVHRVRALSRFYERRPLP